MKTTHFTLICIYLFLISGCTGKLGKDDSNVMIVSINPNEATQIELKSWAKKIEVIPLETTKESLLTGCYKIVDFHDRFYVHDQRQHTIFVYSKTGKYLFSTKHLIGKGPNEYSSIVDFDINRFTNNMELLDAFERKIKVYDKNGNFIRSIILSPELMPLRSFIALTDDIYLFYCKKDTKRDERLLFYSLSKKEILNMCENLPTKVNEFVSTSFNPFFLLNNQIYFSHIFPSNSLFLVNSQKLKLDKYLELNFGELNFTLDVLPENSNKEFYRTFTRSNSDRYAFVVEKIVSNKWILIYFTFKQKLYIAKYDKATKQSKVCYNEPKAIGQLLVPNIIKGDSLYYVTEPGYIKYVINNQLLDINSQNIMNIIKEDDNPVIIKYTLN